MNRLQLSERLFSHYGWMRILKEEQKGMRAICMKRKMLIPALIGMLGIVFLICIFIWKFLSLIPTYVYQEINIAHISYDDLINHRSDLQYENWSESGERDAAPLRDILAHTTYHPLNQSEGQEILSQQKDENTICAIRRSDPDVQIDSNGWIFLDMQVVQVGNKIYLVAEGKTENDAEPATTVWEADDSKAIQGIMAYHSAEKPNKMSSLALFWTALRYPSTQQFAFCIGAGILLAVVVCAVRILRRKAKRG